MTAKEIIARLRGTAVVGFDVDGVFTDGRFYLSDDGVESKAFNTHDGFGVRRLLDAGIEIVVISGRRSGAVERRMTELGVRHVVLGCDDKVAVFRRLLSDLGVASERSVYVGDDVPDLPLLGEAGVAIAVANAHADVRAACDWTTAARGGHGAVREVCDLVLLAHRDAADR